MLFWNIARDLHISRKRMGFAGMKMKKAQYPSMWICISNMESEEQSGKLRIWKEPFIKLIF